ncbi:MAG: hypothetical protein ACRD23_10275 [Terriglobales bacterium]
MLLPKFASVVLAILLTLTVLGAQQKNPLTNADVVKMVKAGMAETTIVAAIAANDTQFDLSSSGLQTLSQAGVSSKVIRAMLAAESKKKDAAAAEANSEAAPDAATAQDASSVTSPQGMAPQGMPPGMSADSMAQMMANMPPEMRERMQASMAKRNARRSQGMGGGAAMSIAPHAGVPVPLDSALYTSFTRLKSVPRYRVVMNMQTTDPRMAQAMAAAAVTSPELTVQGNTRQYVMHYKLPASDVPGTVDDWEIRAVVQNGRAARLMTSPAVPRILKASAEKAAADLAMLDAMAANAVARAAAQGPLGAVSAGMTVAATALGHVEAAKMLKMEKDMFSWKCQPAPPSIGPGGQSDTQLTDFHSVGDEIVDGRPAAVYEFYAYESPKAQGPVRLLVAKDTGLPLQINMGDPNTTGGVQMVYSQLDSPVNIEIPACMSGAK